MITPQVMASLGDSNRALSVWIARIAKAAGWSASVEHYLPLDELGPGGRCRYLMADLVLQPPGATWWTHVVEVKPLIRSGSRTLSAALWQVTRYADRIERDHPEQQSIAAVVYTPSFPDLAAAAEMARSMHVELWTEADIPSVFGVSIGAEAS